MSKISQAMPSKAAHPGTEGFRKASEYVAAQLEEAGLIAREAGALSSGDSARRSECE